jgi:hypothetical protein
MRASAIRRYYAVVVYPLGKLALIGQSTVPGVDIAVYPALPFRAEGDAVELAGGARWIAEAKYHRFAIGPAALGNFEDLVWNSARFIVCCTGGGPTIRDRDFQKPRRAMKRLLCG